MAKKKRTKKTRIKNEAFDTLAYSVSETRKRLLIPNMGRETSMRKLEVLAEQVADADKKLLHDKREDIKRRRKMFKAIFRFEAMVKKALGRKITVKVRVLDFDKIRVTTYFRHGEQRKPRPKRRDGKLIDHPTDGDSAVYLAFRDSGLCGYMEFDGCGNWQAGKNAGLRDHDFTEKKPQLEAE